MLLAAERNAVARASGVGDDQDVERWLVADAASLVAPGAAGPSVVRTPWLILLVLALIPVGEAVYVHSQLPETIPTHFDGHGRPDHWGSKTPYCIVASLLPAIAGLVLLPYLLLASPTCIDSPLCRLPNKDYWTAPERIEATARFVLRQFAWLNAATMALMLVLSHTMLRSAATGRGPTGGQLLIGLGGYLAVVALWMVRFFVHFRAVDTTADDSR